jgi:regulator of protease activity HflC (stomatin/prohibitin superfamily)
MDINVIVAGLVILIVVAIVALGIRIVQQSEVVVIERLGKYKKTLTSGVNLIIPFVDRPRSVMWRYVTEDPLGRRITLRQREKIDLRETLYDFAKQTVITADNVNIEINALLYFQITDPPRAVYEIANLPEAIEKLTQTSLRNVVGGMLLDETLTSRDAINLKLRAILDEATDKWGVKINRVEIQEIVPPEDIRAAMEKQMRAERDRRAAILTAEGQKQAAILQAEGEREASIKRAEGEKQAAILEAEGAAQARIVQAEAEARAIGLIHAALGAGAEQTARFLISTKYLDQLRAIAGTDGKSRLVFMPYEAAGMISSVGSLRELFQGDPGKQD